MNESKLENFVDQVFKDMVAGMAGVMTSLGHRLGLYQAMAGAGALTAAELAQKTQTHERYVLEWLNSQAAAGYVTYSPGDRTYELPDEHAMVLANQNSPVFLAPGFDTVASMWLDEEKVMAAFQTGQGIGWGDHHQRLFCGCEAFYRNGYQAHLTTAWIPSIPGLELKLKIGGKVADVGCGHGASTIIMAQAYPNSTFYGFDGHADSIAVARQRAEEAGVGDRIHFEVASAKDFPGSDYDLVCFMDSFHDFGDPVGAAQHAKTTLAENGVLLLVEPRAGDNIEDNLNPVGRLFYAASTAICVPNSVSQEVGLALGAQAGSKRIGEVLSAAGFGTYNRATETPFNIILEARV